jgi:hypothetical protein
LLSGGYLIRGEDISNIPQAINVDDLTLNEVTSGNDSAQWFSSIDDEIHSLIERDVWEIEDISKAQKHTLVGHKWVFKYKLDEKDDIKSRKTRLVAKGFSQKYGIDYKETFSPVARHTTFRMLLALGVAEDFKYQHIDIKTAFLYGELTETVYMRLPSYVMKYMQEKHGQYTDVDINSAHKKYVLKLKKALYGLKQGGREWYNTIDAFIIEQGFTRSKSDVCLYFKGNEEMKIILLMYVDDIIVASKQNELLADIKDRISKRFAAPFKGSQLSRLFN